ncbi:ribosomal-processing cysteine protease Prp [Limosilactobacillus sp. STM2_1]|uniref:Ribosomal processing cysteine protease Prp n=1 Tax=Limosilactobacillus rudii TaxID=2759755 RepID=A0A7W3YMT8_9LACO|nr:ribosomal-processing cysteine protease Prp [Limosilactobacillus rudii]MBB1080240.1 ribosomal-processing cysteine protease Prp [Limosilactobacillus rudii]MBB1096856.1 ribosomal-processing cysteine protease Prp [Limosilactobacillus rudii]MCD7133754.1 ribosomal-processing cysteine protease Prp [Limosilactobacillus rudii]
MIQVQIKKEPNKTTVIASGHAEYSVKGSDIVCASFSTLLTHTVNNCTDVTVNDENGVLKAVFTDSKRIENKTLLDAFENTVNELVEQYDQYITIL